MEKPNLNTGKVTFTLPRLQLNDRERGLIFGPSVFHKMSSMEISRPPLEPAQLRKALLLWDKINLVELDILDSMINDDISFLISENIVSVSTLKANRPGVWADIYTQSTLMNFLTLDLESPGKWSVAGNETSISFPSSDLEKGRGILFQIHDAIPIPNKEVPIEDILEFKSKRNDELQALRHHFEEVFQTIATSPDVDLARTTQFEKLDSSIQNHIRVSQESKMKLYLSSLDAKINISDLATATISTIAATKGGLPLSSALLAGFATSFSIKSGFGLRGKTKSATPFEYISKAHKDLG